MLQRLRLLPWTQIAGVMMPPREQIQKNRRRVLALRLFGTGGVEDEAVRGIRCPSTSWPAARSWLSVLGSRLPAQVSRLRVVRLLPAACRIQLP